MAVKIFISHSSQDKDFAERIKALLMSAFKLDDKAVRCTSPDGGKYEPGSDFMQEICNDLNEVCAVVALLSENAIKSAIALFEMHSTYFTKRRLIPLLLPRTPAEVLVEPIKRLTAYRCDNLPELHQVIDSLGQALEIPPEPPNAYAVQLSRIFPQEGLLTDGYHVERLHQAQSSFRQGAEIISDERLRKWLLEARLAIEDAAAVIADSWDQGQHLISGLFLAPTPRAQPGWFPLFTSVVSQKVVDRLQRLTGPLACRIITDDYGVVPGGPTASEFTWIVDAIDGSRQMVRSLPLFTTTLTLIDRKGAPVLGLIYVPVTGELYFAVRGYGTYLNSWKSRLELEDLGFEMREKAVIHMEFPNSSTQPPEDLDWLCAAASRVFADVYRVRGLGIGSLGLAYTAKGSFDAYVTFASGTTDCDVLAGQLLVEAAGGVTRKVRLPHGKLEPALGSVRLIAGRRDVVDGLLALDEVAPLFERGR